MLLKSLLWVGVLSISLASHSFAQLVQRIPATLANWSQKGWQVNNYQCVMVALSNRDMQNVSLEQAISDLAATSYCEAPLGA